MSNIMEDYYKKAIIKSGYKLVLNITGGGLAAYQMLTFSGGASAFLLEGTINYSAKSTELLLGKVPKKYTSLETARDLAMQAYLRGKALTQNSDDKILGVAATSKLIRVPENEEREGRKHVLAVAIQTEDETAQYEVPIVGRSREGQELYTAHMILNCIIGFINNSSKGKYLVNREEYYLPGGLGKPTMPVVFPFHISTEWEHIYNPFKNEVLIFAGSFNPIHEGHIQICRAAAKQFKRPVWLEISLTNTDKPPINAISLKERFEYIRQVALHRPHIDGVIISNTPFYKDKIKYYKKPMFILGTDTYNRLDTEALNLDTTYIIAQRKGVELDSLDLRRNWLLNKQSSIIQLEYADSGISSTEIRNAN